MRTCYMQGQSINMHFFTLRNVSFEDGSISGTLTFKQPLEVGSDGKLMKVVNGDA